MRRTLAIVLTVIAALVPVPALAGELTASIASAAQTALSQARPNAPQSDDNPYFLPGVILMAGGGVVALYGMTHPTGAKCSSSRAEFECGTTRSKTTILTGVGLVGVGAYLLHKGRTSTRSPQIVAGPGTVAVRQHLAW